MRPLLCLSLPFASCGPGPRDGPAPGDTYEDPATGSTVSVVATAACSVVREDVRKFGGGSTDTTAVGSVEDLTRSGGGDPATCVAFATAPGDIVITGRAAFLDQFEPKD